MEEYQKFFDAFDRGKQGYIMVTQIGQIMNQMEQGGHTFFVAIFAETIK
jgi:Ca2+-binding EF-hand superfamily protein